MSKFKSFSVVAYTDRGTLAEAFDNGDDARLYFDRVIVGTVTADAVRSASLYGFNSGGGTVLHSWINKGV